MGDLTVKPSSGGKLDLRNNGGTAKVEINDGADIAVTTGSASGDDFKVNTSQLVVEGDTGNVGIGKTPAEKLDVLNTAQVTGAEGTSASLYLVADEGDDNGDGWRITSNQDVNDLTISNNTSGSYVDKLTLTSSGVLLVDKTSSGSSGDGLTLRNDSNNGGRITFTRVNETDTQFHMAFYTYSGTKVGEVTTSTSSTAYVTSSDYRLKDNVTQLTGAIDRLNQLKPSRFNFIADPETTLDGFLAHEVSDLVPEAITGEKDAMTTETYEVTPAVKDENDNIITEAIIGEREVPNYQGIDQSKLVPLLVASVQELSAKVTALENA